MWTLAPLYCHKDLQDLKWIPKHQQHLVEYRPETCTETPYGVLERLCVFKYATQHSTQTSVPHGTNYCWHSGLLCISALRQRLARLSGWAVNSYDRTSISDKVATRNGRGKQGAGAAACCMEAWWKLWHPTSAVNRPNSFYTLTLLSHYCWEKTIINLAHEMEHFPNLLNLLLLQYPSGREANTFENGGESWKAIGWTFCPSCSKQIHGIVLAAVEPVSNSSKLPLGEGCNTRWVTLPWWAAMHLGVSLKSLSDSQSGVKWKHLLCCEKPSVPLFVLSLMRKWDPVLIKLLLLQHPC